MLPAAFIASDVRAQERACGEFSAWREEMSDLQRSYREHRDPAFLDTLIAASQMAERCPTTDSERASLYHFWTWGLFYASRLEESLEVFESFDHLTPAPEDSARWANMLFLRGDTYLRLGRFAESHRALARASEYAASFPLARRARILFMQAAALGRASAVEESLIIFDSIATLLETEGASLDADERAYFQGRVLWERADALKLLSHERPSRRDALLSAALDAAERSVTVLSGSSPPLERERAIALLVLAAIEHVLDRGVEAEAHILEAVHLAESSGNTSLHAEARMDLGEYLLERGHTDAAISPLRRALALAREADDTYRLKYALLLLGRAYERAGLLAEAEVSYREAAALAETFRAGLGTSEQAAMGFSAWQEPFRRLAGLHLRMGREREAFALLEQTRARHLSDLRRARERFADLSARERARLDSLDAEIERLRSSLLTDPDSTSSIPLRLTDLLLQRHGPQANVAEYVTPTLTDIQRALGTRGQALVSYFIADSSYAFVLTPDAFHTVRLGVTEAVVDSLVRGISPLWQGETDVLSRDAVAYDTGALHGLYLAIFAPIRDLLPPGTPLVIIPDGRLREVPFAMLLEAPTPRFQYAGAPFLLRRHPISTDLAAAFLVEPDTHEHEWRHDLLAIGRSEFDLPASAPRRSGGGPFPNLPSVRDELRALQRLFRRAVVALDEQASEAALLTQMSGARVIHIASHAAVDAERPLYSRIELWPDSSAGDDGRLHLFELAGRDVPAELVVLSGCSTARGQVLGGEGAMGLHYGFRAAGSAASVGTLWHVDDEASGALMVRFYHHLRAGLPKDRALQQAQLDFLAEAEGMRASPFYWAAPVLYGDAGVLTWSESGSLSPLAWAAIGTLLLLFGLALPRLNVWTYERMEV